MLNNICTVIIKRIENTLLMLMKCTDLFKMYVCMYVCRQCMYAHL